MLRIQHVASKITIVSNLYLQSFQKFQIWDIVSSKKEDEQFPL